ncbi:MAG: exodeoxyribonuclease III [Candidatus Micrarchaeota archaeon]
MKLISWNVNGIRAVLKKDFMQFLKTENPDILCLQETKTGHDPKVEAQGYLHYYNFASKKGYSGTAILTKEKPISVSCGMGAKEHDDEGRIIVAEYKNFILINVYTPNAGVQTLARLSYRQKWDLHFLKFMQALEAKKPILVCGDMNVAHTEIDLARPKQNEHNAGFTKEEREGFQRYINAGFLDTFRLFHPNEKNQYSWWSYRFSARAKNIGWRIDYFLASPKLKSKIKSAKILQNIHGSDHAPVEIELG